MKKLIFFICISLLIGCENKETTSANDDAEYIDSLIENNLFDSSVTMIVDTTTSMIGK
jgi:hypothetical protein